jgi:hypothetical protein
MLIDETQLFCWRDVENWLKMRGKPLITDWTKIKQKNIGEVPNLIL